MTTTRADEDRFVGLCENVSIEWYRLVGGFSSVNPEMSDLARSVYLPQVETLLDELREIHGLGYEGATPLRPDDREGSVLVRYLISELEYVRNMFSERRSFSQCAFRLRDRSEGIALLPTDSARAVRFTIGFGVGLVLTEIMSGLLEHGLDVERLAERSSLQALLEFRAGVENPMLWERFDAGWTLSYADAAGVDLRSKALDWFGSADKRYEAIAGVGLLDGMSTAATETLRRLSTEWVGRTGELIDAAIRLAKTPQGGKSSVSGG